MSVYGVLLAGGRSSRMGQDKRLLRHDGLSLLDRSLNLLEQSGADRVLISGEVPGYETIPDILSGCGPLGGLHAAIHFIDREAGLDEDSLLLVIPVDMPMLTVRTLVMLASSVGEAGSCHFEDEIFPCVFRLTTGLRDHLDRLFADSRELGGSRSMRALLGVFGEKVVTRDGVPEQAFMNLNRPEDWHAFQALRKNS